MGAQVQQQPMKIQCLLPATPTASSIAKQESKLNAAALEEHDPPLEVMAQPEAVCTCFFYVLSLAVVAISVLLTTLLCMSSG